MLNSAEQWKGVNTAAVHLVLLVMPGAARYGAVAVATDILAKCVLQDAIIGDLRNVGNCVRVGIAVALHKVGAKPARVRNGVLGRREGALEIIVARNRIAVGVKRNIGHLIRDISRCGCRQFCFVSYCGLNIRVGLYLLWRGA